MITEIVQVPASHVRAAISELTSPDASKCFVIERHGKPVMLIWPAKNLTDGGTMRTRLSQAIKARNAFSQSDATLPLYPRRWPQTTLRRNATDVYLDIAASPTPGLITHYGRDVAIYVPLRSMDHVRQWVETMNGL